MRSFGEKTKLRSSGNFFLALIDCQAYANVLKIDKACLAMQGSNNNESVWTRAHHGVPMHLIRLTLQVGNNRTSDSIRSSISMESRICHVQNRPKDTELLRRSFEVEPSSGRSRVVLEPHPRNPRPWQISPFSALRRRPLLVTSPLTIRPSFRPLTRYRDFGYLTWLHSSALHGLMQQTHGSLSKEHPKPTRHVCGLTHVPRCDILDSSQEYGVYLQISDPKRGMAIKTGQGCNQRTRDMQVMRLYSIFHSLTVICSWRSLLSYPRSLLDSACETRVDWSCSIFWTPPANDYDIALIIPGPNVSNGAFVGNGARKLEMKDQNTSSEKKVLRIVLKGGS